MKKIFLIILVIVIGPLYGQDTTYYTNNWEEISSNKNYEYYTVLEKDKQNTDHAAERTYYKSGQIKEETFYSYYSKKYRDGKCKAWYSNGNLRREIDYKDGDYHGKILTYWENGLIKRNDTYEFNKLIEGHLKNSDGSYLPYYAFETMPMYPGGVEEMQRFIVKEIKYPKKARRKGIYGKVIIKFLVDEDGSIIRAIVTKSIDKDLDAEALRIVNRMPKWEPGKYDGEKVQVYFNLPFAFRLKD